MDATPDPVTLPRPAFTPSGTTVPQAVSAFPSSAVHDQTMSQVAPRQLEQVLEEANRVLTARQTGIRFIQQDALPRPIIQIVDEASGEVLRQIPNEAAVRIAEALTGLLVDQRA